LPFKFLYGSVCVVGLGPILTIFSAAVSPSTLLLSHVSLAVFIAFVTKVCASAFVLLVALFRAPHSLDSCISSHTHTLAG